MARILLAEDDNSLRGFLTRALEKAGHSVVDCENGDDAIDALDQGPWDLLLTEASILTRMLDYPVVVSATGTVPRHNTENWLKSRGLGLPDPYLETLSVSVARLVVMNSDSVWFASVGAVRDDLTRGLLYALPLGFEGTEEPVGLLHRSDAVSSPALQALMKILRGVSRSRTVAQPR